MDPPHNLDFAFEYEGREVARTVARSISQEVGEIDDERSSATVTRDGRVVSIHIDAADLVALRAAANTWLSLTVVAERVANKAGVFEP